VIAFLSDQYPALAASLARPGPPHFANPLTRLKNGPPLRDVLAKVDRRWIASWLKNPQSHDANTFMPNLSLGSEDMDAIIAYLSDVARPVARRNEWDAAWSKLIDQMSDQELEILDRRLLEGKRLWSESRCTICHGVGGRPGEAAHAPALTRAAVKLLPDWLPGWLEDPQSHFPTTWMPRFAFTDRERASLAVYLLRGDEFGGLEADSLRGGGSPPPSPAALASQGRDVITRNRCVVCHDVPGIEEVLPPQPPSIEPRDEFERLVRDTRCLTCHRIAPEPPTEALTLAARRAPPGSAESTRFGGTFAPDLTTAGSRLRRDWIEKFLVAPDVIRPLLKQMPKLRLTGEQARMAADYLKQNLTDPRIHPDFLRDFAPAADELELGRKIYDAKGCIACHQMGPTGGAIGPTLTAAADRLEPGYTYEHLRNPQRLWPDVVEPNYGLTNREAMELTRFLHRRTSTRDSASRVARERVQTVMNNEQRTMNNGQLGMNNGD
jgi:cbb3-type cytochrome oxidase cytochrome c subunit